MSKKFKDTKLGVFLGNTAPHILEIAGDLLPNAGVLGIVKNLIEKDDKIKPEDKKEALAQTKEMYELEIKDRDSARNREIEVKKTGNKDLMMTFTGIVGLVSFMFIIYAVVYEEAVLHNDLFVHLMGMVEGVVISNIFAYYYGSSAEK
jgi:Fe2+ transport system protein B